MNIRSAIEDDSGVIRSLIQEGIRANLGQHYSNEQIDAWSSGFSKESIGLAIKHTIALVAEIDGSVVGFGNIEISDDDMTEIHLLYVSPHHQRSGIGTSLIEQLEKHAMQAGKLLVQSDASLLALGLLLKMGYSIRESYIKTYNGIEFPNTWVEKNLNKKDKP